MQSAEAERDLQLCGVRSEYQLLQVALNDHILHGAHGDFQQIRVGGIREVAIDLLFWIPVQGPEFIHKVLARLLVVRWGSVVICESMVGNGAFGELLLE